MLDMSNSRATDALDANAGHDILSGIVIPEMAADTNRRIFLPRGSGVSALAPQPYYYPASKTGAVPSWAISQMLGRNEAADRADAAHIGSQG